MAEKLSIKEKIALAEKRAAKEEERPRRANPPRPQQHHQQSRTSEGAELRVTDAEQHAGVLVKMAARVFRLRKDGGAARWEEVGNGALSFRLDYTVDKVMLTMGPAPGGGKRLMNHPVHPAIGLQKNRSSARSWVWTTSDYAHLDADGKATVQTFAAKFKSGSAARLFAERHKKYRDLNQLKEKSAKVLLASEKLSRQRQMSRHRDEADRTLEPAEAAIHRASVADAGGDGMPQAPPQEELSGDAAAALPSSPRRPVGRAHSDRTAPSAAPDAAAGAAAGSAAARDDRAASGLPPRHAARSAVLSGGAGAAPGGKRNKLLSMLGAEVPARHVALQTRVQYSASNDSARRFPRAGGRVTRCVRYREGDPPPRQVPRDEREGTDAEHDAKEREAAVETRRLLAVDLVAARFMLKRLRRDNAVLRRMAAREEAGAAAAADVTALAHTAAETTRLGACARRAAENRRMRAQWTPKNAKMLQVPRAGDSCAQLPEEGERQALWNAASPPGDSADLAHYPDPPPVSVNLRVATFRVTKVNKIRRNTPRLFELSLSNSRLVIYKNRDDDDTATTSDFAIRDLVVTRNAFADVREMPDNPRGLVLVFDFGASRTEAGRSSGKLSGIKSSHKTWRVLCGTADDRTRLYQLLHLHVMPARRAPTTEEVAAMRASMAGGAAAAPLSRTSSASLVSATYVPQPFVLPDAVLQAARRLPVQRLAAELHRAWLTQRVEDGWRYDRRRVDPQERLHTSLVPFQQLAGAQSQHFAETATQIVGIAIHIGWSFEPPGGGGGEFGGGGGGGGATEYGGGAFGVVVVGGGGGVLGAGSGVLGGRPVSGGLGGGGGGGGGGLVDSSSSGGGLLGGGAWHAAGARVPAAPAGMIQRVQFLASQVHEWWCDRRMQQGWSHAPTFSEKDATDPTICAFSRLPGGGAPWHNAIRLVLGRLLRWGWTMRQEA